MKGFRVAEVTFESHCIAASLFGQRHVQDSILATFPIQPEKTTNFDHHHIRCDIDSSHRRFLYSSGEFYTVD